MQAWDALSQEDKELSHSKEESIKVKVEKELETYELDKQAHIQRIEKRIEKGFELNVSIIRLQLIFLSFS